MTATPTPTPVYHPAVDQILTRLLGNPGAVADLRRTAETPGCEPLTALLHDAALRTGERHIQLARKIKHMLADLQAATREIADARPAEHLLTGRHDELLTLAARHHDALTHLEKLTQALAASRTTNI
jgi:hypothetical protein